MADHSLEAENSPAFRRGRRRHTTPVRSEYVSTSSFSTSSSYVFPHLGGAGRGANPTPASPFATDGDRSWQGELSWQFEPSGWHENRDFGAAFGPWTTSSSATPRSRIFRRSANDYFLSRTYGGNPSQDFSRSGYDLAVRPQPQRLELQSYIGPAQASPMVTISEGSGRSLVDETASLDQAVPGDMDRQMCLIKTYRDLNYKHEHEQDQRWFSVSHAYMDRDDHDHDHRNQDHDHHKVGSGDLEGGGGHSMPAVVDYHDEDEGEGEDEEDEAVAQRSVGLLGLFRYAMMLDLVLILFGCLGAFINGGSLPFYSLLFGKFVNKLALGGSDKKKMMEEVDTVCIFYDACKYMTLQKKRGLMTEVVTQ